MTVHVVLWFWKGWRPIYTWRHVNAMVRMLRPELPAHARILCLSDQAQSAWMPAECEVAKLWTNPVKTFANRPNCFLRLKLLNASTQKALGIEPGDIVMWMDLDSVVLPGWPSLLNALEPSADADGPDVSDWYHFAAMGGLAARIHGSLVAFRAGTHADIWDKFHPVAGPLECMQPMADGTERPVGSDQAWLSRKITGEYLWQAADGCYSWNRHALCMPRARTANAVYWSFAGEHKPWSPLVKQCRPDLHEAYMAAYGDH